MGCTFGIAVKCKDELQKGIPCLTDRSRLNEMLLFACYGWLLMSNELAKPIFYTCIAFHISFMDSEKVDHVSIKERQCFPLQGYIQYVSMFLASHFSNKLVLGFSRLPETDLSRVMDEREAADEYSATAQKEERVSILHFFEIRCFSVILLIYFQNSASSAVAVISLDFVQKAFFYPCCLMLINVNTACDLIPELLLTAASADIPAGTTLVWTFLKTRRVYCVWY